MKIVIAIDSFKGSLSSLEAAESISRGVLAVDSCAEISICPLADGGEGTVAALSAALGTSDVQLRVRDPLGRQINTSYAITPDGKTAVMEMSACAGITLVSDGEKDPRITTTFGVGEMINDAIARGCEQIIMGIGGSATNDAGIGMLAALGFEFYDRNGAVIEPYGAVACGKVAKISGDQVPDAVRRCRFTIACDVNNPLCGDRGCSAVYGPQKGADAACVREMDEMLSSYADAVKKFNPDSDRNASGAGAAGGLGFAFLSFLNSELVAGAELVIRANRLEEKISECDVVVTGEGRIDFQSAMGKAPYTVACLGKKYGKKVVAFCGAVGRESLDSISSVFDGVFPIATAAMSLEDAMDITKASKNLEFTARQVFNLINS